jgi:anti-anti-sigma factor
MGGGRAGIPQIETSAVAAAGATVHVVEIEGALELPTVSALRRELARLAEAGAKKLLLDLTHVDFMDLAGVTTLYRAGLGARLAIAVPAGSQPARTLAHCRLDGTIPAFADRAAAFAALSRRRA